MAAFFGQFFQYVIEAIVLLAIGLCGGAIGIKLRKNKDAKTEAENGQ